MEFLPSLRICFHHHWDEQWLLLHRQNYSNQLIGAVSQAICISHLHSNKVIAKSIERVIDDLAGTPGGIV